MNTTFPKQIFYPTRAILCAILFSFIFISNTSIEKASAHEGHGEEEVGEYDLDAPRRLSSETEKHIGLEVAEVEMHPIEEVVKISGIVKPKPSYREIIAARIDAQVENVYVQVGDLIERGKDLVSLTRADGSQISLALSHLKQGTVVSQSAISGRWVNKGDSLFEVIDYRTVHVKGQLPESLIPRILKRTTERARVMINGEAKSNLEGKIVYLSPELDPVKRTADVVVEVSNANTELRGEMWVDLVLILRESKEAIVVPRSSVVVYGPLHFVFIKSGDTYVKQDINPGIVNDEYVEILDGLVLGDEVVTQGAYSLTQIRPK